MPSLRLKSKNFLFIILLFGLLLRIGLVLNLPNRVFWTDESDYLALADRVLDGEGYVNKNGTPTAYRAVGYPVFLIFLKLFGLHSLLAIRIVQSILSIITLYLVYLLTRRLFGAKIALFAVFLSSIYPYYIFLPATLLATTWYCLILILSTFTLYYAVEKQKSTFFALSGFLFGFVALIRPVGQVLFGAAVVWYFFYQRHKKQLIKPLSIFILTFIVVVGPWYYRNYTKLHIVNLVTNGGRNLWLGNNPSSTINSGSNLDRPEDLDGKIMEADSEVERDSIYLHEAKQYIKQNPGRFIWLSFRKGLSFWRWDPSPTTGGYVKLGTLINLASIITFGPIFILAVCGFIFANSEIRRLVTLWLWYALFYTAPHAIFISKVRFRLPLDYFLIILASFAAVNIGLKIRQMGVRIFFQKLLRKEITFSPQDF
ncbi:glycosyltransferase family 39 protein [candidate division KSB1 bacterium]|nr:glycosyltransferase family 39 protein [candidate division KSB1 bacterium]